VPGRLGRIGHWCALFGGACVGCFAFLLFAAILLGKPIHDTILSAHGVLTASKPVKLTFEQNAMVMDLLQKGALISSNDLLAYMSSFYSTIIQWLIGTFAVFGFISFYAVQAHVRRQVEEITEPLVEKTTRHRFESRAFDTQVQEKVGSLVEIEMDTFNDRLGQFETMQETVQQLENRLAELTGANQAATAPGEE
jgi:polyhydroxyalkanoate synthesis regulator protein